jgi:phosphate transport system substrate-binding protein
MSSRQVGLIALGGLALIILSWFLVTAGAPADTVTIQGAGATFPAPLYQRWFLEYYQAHKNVRVNYQAIGSGAGVNQLQENLVEFAASDEALSKSKLQEVAAALAKKEGKPVELIQLPLTAGAVGLCYNVPGNPELVLPPDVYVRMALGEITNWNDPAIQEANPNVKLPNQRITFIRRAESSGTTFVFTTHLNAVDDRWKLDKDRPDGSHYKDQPDGPGVSKTPQWKVGIGGKGNAGVAALIDQTPGAFGYLEAGYAELKMQEPGSSLRMAKLVNQAGNPVEPSNENSRVALEEAKFNDVFGATIPNPKGKSAYPIITFTWVIVRKHYDDKALGDRLKAVLSYCLEDEEGRGQSLSKDLGYVALPKETLERARKAIQEINADEMTR